jgi:DNA-binding helix-hairpin-helix protein with protein kinase domain
VSVSTLYDHLGRAWPLAQEVNSGGEGTIYTLAHAPDLVAKVYKELPAAETADKLRYMIQVGGDDLQQRAAWPAATLHDAPGGPLVGFLMPRFADRRPIQNLYGLTPRRRYFPDADWDFLLRAAENIAAAFAAVHARGVVIGDVNAGNLLVSATASVCLIDCDSFQVQAGRRLFRCLVGVPEFTPPELQKKSLAGVARTVNHDRFGLAVLIFHLLFMGKHPFVGCPLDDREPDPDEDIRLFRFAYGREAPALRLQPPPLTPTLDVVSAELRELFERAFGRGSDAAGRRPSAEEWLGALGRFRTHLRPCSKDPAGHKVPPHLSDCPWCRIVAAGGPDYFAGVAAVGAEFVFDRTRLFDLCKRGQQAAVWTAEPDRQRELSNPQPEPVPEEVLWGRTLSRIIGGVALIGPVLLLFGLAFKALAIFGLIVLLVFGIWWLVLFFNSPFAREKQARWRALTEARRALEDEEAEAERLLEDYLAQKNRLVEQVNQFGHAWQRLPQEYKNEYGALERNREALARDDFLRSRLLADEEVARIGPGRKKVLAAHNIESAFDVEEHRIRAIKGFGPALTNNLLQWRANVLAEFRFDPSVGVPRAEAQSLALKYKQRQDSLRLRLEQEVKHVELLGSRTEQDWRPRHDRISRLVADLAKAEADFAVLGGSRFF